MAWMTKGDYKAALRKATDYRTELEESLRELIKHGRPAFPRTPYRKALDRAERLINYQG